MSDHDPVPSMPPPRWKSAGTVDPFIRNLLLVGVGLLGMLAGCTCCWTGLIHDTVEDSMKRRGDSYLPGQPSNRQVEPGRIVRDPNNEIVPGGKPRLEVRRSLRPMPDPEPKRSRDVDDGGALPDSRDPVPAPPKKAPKSGMSENEMFGVR